MGMNRELAQLVRVPPARRRNRWYGDGVSACVARIDAGETPRKQVVNWDKILGLATVVTVVALAWTALGFAVSHFLR